MALMAILCGFAGVLARGWPLGGTILEGFTALGTVAAALISAFAVRVALQQGAKTEVWKREQEQRELAIIQQIVRKDIELAYNGLAILKNELDLWHVPSHTRTGGHMLQAIARASSLLQLEGCWRLLEKLAWLPSAVGQDVSRVMAEVPPLLNGMTRSAAWDGSMVLLLQHLNAMGSTCDELIKCSSHIDQRLRTATAT